MANWVGASEVCENFNISYSTLKKWKRRGKIDYKYNGKKTFLYDMDSVINWMTSWTVAFDKRIESRNIIYFYKHPLIELEDVAEFLRKNNIQVSQAFVEEHRTRPLLDYILTLTLKGKIKNLYYFNDGDFTDNQVDFKHYSQIFRCCNVNMVKLNLEDEYKEIAYAVQTSTPSSDMLNKLIDAELIFINNPTDTKRRMAQTRTKYYTDYATRIKNEEEEKKRKEEEKMQMKQQIKEEYNIDLDDEDDDLKAEILAELSQGWDDDATVEEIGEMIETQDNIDKLSTSVDKLSNSLK